MISAAVIAAGMLASCSNKEIVDEQPETDGVSASVLNIVPTVGTDTRAGFVPKTEWAVNDAMGLFMYKATGWGDAYPRYDAQNNCNLQIFLCLFLEKLNMPQNTPVTKVS